jgi:hypothetical protein
VATPFVDELELFRTEEEVARQYSYRIGLKKEAAHPMNFRALRLRGLCGLSHASNPQIATIIRRQCRSRWLRSMSDLTHVELLWLEKRRNASMLR